METAIFALLGTLVGGMITYFLQRSRFNQEILLKQEENKTEFMAESTANYFLNHKDYTDRSFEVLKSNLGGFSDDDLRKILVRAGAIRTYTDDGIEYWRLLSRMDEYIERNQN